MLGTYLYVDRSLPVIDVSILGGCYMALSWWIYLSEVSVCATHEITPTI